MFFFKLKTAYEMRISDWSSDVCSSDLLDPRRRASQQPRLHPRQIGDVGRPDSVQHIGMTAKDAGRRTGRVEQHMIELPSRRPFHDLGLDQFGPKYVPPQNLPEHDKALWVALNRSDNGSGGGSRSDERRMGKECVSK